MSILRGVGSSGSVGPTSGGKVYAFNNIDADDPVTVAPANPNRVSISFHNPGTVDIIICPALVQTSGVSAANSATVGSKGGSYLLYANGGERTITGECQGAFYALAVSASGNPLTVTDSNV